VGPWVDRLQVNEYQQELQAQFQLAGIVVPYEI
jgi:cell division septation protein DedD